MKLTLQFMQKNDTPEGSGIRVTEAKESNAKLQVVHQMLHERFHFAGFSLAVTSATGRKNKKKKEL